MTGLGCLTLGREKLVHSSDTRRPKKGEIPHLPHLVLSSRVGRVPSVRRNGQGRTPRSRMELRVSDAPWHGTVRTAILAPEPLTATPAAAVASLPAWGYVQARPRVKDLSWKQRTALGVSREGLKTPQQRSVAMTQRARGVWASLLRDNMPPARSSFLSPRV